MVLNCGGCRRGHSFVAFNAIRASQLVRCGSQSQCYYVVASCVSPAIVGWCGSGYYHNCNIEASLSDAVHNLKPWP